MRLLRFTSSTRVLPRFPVYDLTNHSYTYKSDKHYLLCIVQTVISFKYFETSYMYITCRKFPKVFACTGENDTWAASWQNHQNGICAQRRLRSAWASAQSDQSSLSAWRKLGPLATHWAHSEGSDHTGRMPRLIWVFVGCTIIVLVLSRGGSFIIQANIAGSGEIALAKTFDVHTHHK